MQVLVRRSRKRSRVCDERTRLKNRMTNALAIKKSRALLRLVRACTCTDLFEKKFGDQVLSYELKFTMLWRSVLLFRRYWTFSEGGGVWINDWKIPQNQPSRNAPFLVSWWLTKILRTYHYMIKLYLKGFRQ